MKITLSGTRTNIVLEGDVYELLFDLADIRGAYTQDGFRILDEIKFKGDATIKERDNWSHGCGIEKSWYILPTWNPQYIVHLKLHDNGDFDVRMIDEKKTEKFIYQKALKFIAEN